MLLKTFKAMKQAVVRDLSTPELKDKLAEELAGIARLRLSHTVSPLENPLKLREARRTIARLKTELHKRENKEQNN